jgi:hypothetical protein
MRGAEAHAVALRQKMARFGSAIESESNPRKRNMRHWRG